MEGLSVPKMHSDCREAEGDAGYTMAEDNLSCTDVDECENPAICPDKNKECLNTEGSYSCICIDSSYNITSDGDCRCRQGEQSRICKSCNPGAVLIQQKYRTFCKDQIAECDVFEQSIRHSATLKHLERLPNYKQVTRGYNINRGDPLGLTDETDPGFTNSHIFSVVRKENERDRSCSYKGYIDDISKICQGSRNSVVFTNSDDILKSLEKEHNSKQIIDGGEVEIGESENAQFTNSKSFGEHVILSKGNKDINRNDACVDKGLATSAAVGEILENNGQTTQGTETTTSRTSEASLGLEFKGFSAKSEQSKTDSFKDSHSSSNGWSQANSRTGSSGENINTRFCADSSMEKSVDQDKGNIETKGDEQLKGTQITKTFSVPGYFDSVTNSASVTQAEKHFRKYSGAIVVSSRNCKTYKLEMEASNPPSFTDGFKASLRSLHDLTVETRSHRLIVVKTGERQFNTTLNSTTEERFDTEFREFTR